MPEKLPHLCPEHPLALIRHEWKRMRLTVQPTGAQIEYDQPGSYQYFCGECGRELAPEYPDTTS